MLHEFDFKQKNPFADEKRTTLGHTLAALQRELEKTDKSLLVVIDGWECTGKGFVLSDLVRELDPRYYEVRLFSEPTSREKDHTFLWRYMRQLPVRGHMMFFDQSQYYEALHRTDVNQDRLNAYIADIHTFERMLVADGTLILKFFLHQPEEKMAKRVAERKKEREETTFFEKDSDEEQLENYRTYLNHFDRVLEQTNFDEAPWQVISTQDRKDASRLVLGRTIEALQAHLKKEPPEEPELLEPCVGSPLDVLSLTRSLDKETYEARLETLQKQAGKLLMDCYRQKLPVIVALEGTDAAGKGGTIRRLTRLMDPRGFDVATVSAPSEFELSHHYMWRFYRDFPEKGMMTIFDRTWYGRVLVEKIEGLTPLYRINEAYGEINEMEGSLVRNGVLLLKFLLVISKKEQKNRFLAREKDPDKQYKLTDEDWRNHDKFEAYEEAMNEMLCRTQRSVPWHVVPTEDKRWGRIRILEIFVESVAQTLEKKRAENGRTHKK